MGSSAEKVLRVQDTSPQKVEVGTTIHLALNELKTSDMAFDQTIAEGQGEGSANSVIVTNGTCEGFKGRNGCLRNLGKPVVQNRDGALT